MSKHICIVFIISLTACYAGQGVTQESQTCSHRISNTSIHAVSTDKQILDILIKQAPKGMFPLSTKVIFLGTVKNNHASYNLVFTSLIWGEAKRETARLVIFSSDWRYLGNYGGIYKPPSVIYKGVLCWPYPARLGNQISLTGPNLPRKVVLNGEIYYFDAEKQ